MEKTLKVTIPEEYEIDEEKSTFKEIVFRKKEKYLPKSFEELENVMGWYINGDDGTVREQLLALDGTEDIAKDVWPTKELAEAALAMSQLMQLRKAWIGDWKPLYEEGKEEWYIGSLNGLLFYETSNRGRTLTFPTQEMARDFYEEFFRLLEQAKPLL